MSTRTYPCTACSAKLIFTPGTHAMQCPYCGTQNEIERADDEAVADATARRDYDAAIAAGLANEPPLAAQAVRCTGCGAESKLDANLVADRCPFCAAPVVVANAYAARQLKPTAIAPFDIPEREARERFKQWITGLWFAPNALKKSYRANRGLKGRYLPYWSYDSETDTPYVGARGDAYYETEHYTDSNGQSRTRQVRKIRWTPVSGRVQVSFRDVLSPGSRSLPADYTEGLEPWRLERLQPYRDEFVAGFTVEAYSVGLQPAFDHACTRMEPTIRSAICRDIGGDEQRIVSMTPRYENIAFVHMLLPVWLSTYGYGGKTYRFLVNGQTGEVQGERPYSAWKIAFAVLAALAVVGTIIYLAQHH
jgi:DNA-directed RNA polymerase subunit RPC12/RpoP